MKALVRIVSTLLKPWPSLAVWLVVLFVASSVPLPEGRKVDFPLGPDKICHGLAYAVLGALAVRALWPARSRGALIGAGLLGAIAYGALLEGWQHLVGRDAEVGDVIADAVGAAIGGLVAVAASIENRRGNRNEQERSDHDEGGRSEAD